jgi:hypothetical protein
MAHSPPNDPIKIPPKPFPSEGEMANEKRRVLEEQKRESGSLPDQPPDNPVSNPIPYKRLK